MVLLAKETICLMFEIFLDEKEIKQKTKKEFIPLNTYNGSLSFEDIIHKEGENLHNNNNSKKIISVILEGIFF